MLDLQNTMQSFFGNANGDATHSKAASTAHEQNQEQLNFASLARGSELDQVGHTRKKSSSKASKRRASKSTEKRPAGIKGRKKSSAKFAQNSSFEAQSNMIASGAASSLAGAAQPNTVAVDDFNF